MTWGTPFCRFCGVFYVKIITDVLTVYYTTIPKKLQGFLQILYIYFQYFFAEIGGDVTWVFYAARRRIKAFPSGEGYGVNRRGATSPFGGGFYIIFACRGCTFLSVSTERYPKNATRRWKGLNLCARAQIASHPSPSLTSPFLSVKGGVLYGRWVGALEFFRLCPTWWQRNDYIQPCRDRRSEATRAQ